MPMEATNGRSSVIGMNVDPDRHAASDRGEALG